MGGGDRRRGEGYWDDSHSLTAFSSPYFSSSSSLFPHLQWKCTREQESPLGLEGEQRLPALRFGVLDVMRFIEDHKIPWHPLEGILILEGLEGRRRKRRRRRERRKGMRGRIERRIGERRGREGVQYCRR